MTGERRGEGREKGGAEGTLEHDAATDREYTTEERTRALDAASRPRAPDPGRAGDFRRDRSGTDRIESPAPAEAGEEPEEDASLRRQAEAGPEPSRQE